jgi:RNA polymerase sigma-70 factor (ECF subfamily)
MSDPQSREGSPVPSAQPASDRSLLRRLRLGEEDAPTELYFRYAARLRALAERQGGADLARRMDPEDIVQSVFRTFFRRAAEGHYDVPQGEEIWKLLLVIALNKVRAAGAYHRAARRDVRATVGGEALDGAAADHGRDEQALAVLKLVVEELVSGLPEAHRRMVEMRIEEHEVADIAAAVGRSKRSVERVLQDFRARLGRLIEGGE